MQSLCVKVVPTLHYDIALKHNVKFGGWSNGSTAVSF